MRSNFLTDEEMKSHGCEQAKSSARENKELACPRVGPLLREICRLIPSGGAYVVVGDFLYECNE